MTHLLFRLVTGLITLFTVGIVALRSQPYDDSDLRDFLSVHQDCAIPCFMDITPGETSRAEALLVLDTHEWVKEVNTRHGSLLTWTWSGLQPPFIDPESKGALSAQGGGQLVWNIAIRTTLPVAAMYLVKGGPNINDHKLNPVEGSLFISAAYPELSLLTFTQIRCPVNTWKYWHSWLGLEFQPVSQINPTNDIQLRC